MAEANQTTPTKFGILLFPGFEPLDVFGPAEVFQTLSRSTHLDLYLISNVHGTSDLAPVSTAPIDPSLNPHNSTFFQAVQPTHTLDTVPADLEVLLIPGGFGTHAPVERFGPTIDFVRETYPRLHSLITVCTGASIAARAGVLDGKRATGNKKDWDFVTSTGPNVNWDKGPRWIVDGNVWTSGGVSAGTDAALGWVATQYGEDIARRTANDIEYEWRNDPNWDVFAYVW
ncbi:class I glutamine amidotransferase-like protein [Earliella scabrosa]|nr:class I glutamine amidotransferase-like protein [Earliella scabrosa]